MAADLFGFTAAQVERLKKIAEAVEASDISPIQSPGRRPLNSAKVAVGILTSSIAAISGLTGTPTVGTLNVYSFTSAGTEDTGVDITVYNFAPQAATTDRWAVAERDAFTGNWVLTTQFCS